ncbi:hypothetical protein AUC61_19955 [Pseudomonas sp. S25]|uniref:Pilus assembly protein n=1 Tax=Pseudomonas maioricensis TaxID=1766623 RepID=A0ABS9ZMK8_9PSED|nr:hypothetical protein [Pseudomonas sp. S25]MCI8211811.1 hypothetical protein [Pseudomonas sp. S25]
MKYRSPARQRGNALVEAALIMPLLIGTALISADLYNVSQARSYLEQSAHNIASVLAMQNRLDSDGLDALIEQAAAPGVLGDYQMIISRVALDRKMPWRPIYRGSGEDICPSYSASTRYTGDLPEERSSENKADEDDTQSKTTLLVVQLCRNSNTLALSSNLLVDKTLQAVAFSRMVYTELELDDRLAQEVGQEQDD